MRLRKLIVDDGRATRHVMLTGTVTVGRDPACQICDPDPLLSRRHAEFVPDAERVVIRDLGSRNGILVNGVKVPERVLVPGDLVQLGHLQCRYVEQPAPPAPEPRLAALAQPATAIPGAPPRGVPLAPPPSRLRDLDDTRPSTAFADILPEALQPVEPRLSVELPEIRTIGDFDVTFAPTTMPAAPAATPAAAPADPEATRVVATSDTPAVPVPEDPDATFASAGRATVAVPEIDFDQTMAPAGSEAPTAPVSVLTIECTATADLTITEFAAADLDRFGLGSKQIVGSRLTDLPARVVERMGTGRGMSALTCIFERSADGQTITMTMTAGEATGH